MTTETKPKKKLNIKKILLVFLLLYFLMYFFTGVTTSKIKNIYIYGNTILKDQKIIELANISNYPSFYFTTSNSIKRKLLANPFIKSVKIKKNFNHQIHIYITENRALFQKKSDSKIVLSNNKELVYDYKLNNIPVLINFVPSEKYKKLVDNMILVKKDIINKMSEVEYNPNDVDKERFLISMNDGNYVYLTLSKFKQINCYEEVVPQLEGKKGILYLDSGKYFQIIN